MGSFSDLLADVEVVAISDVEGQVTPGGVTPSGIYRVTGKVTFLKLDEESGRIKLAFKGKSEENSRGVATSVVIPLSIRLAVEDEEDAWKVENDWAPLLGLVENGAWPKKVQKRLLSLKARATDGAGLGAFLDELFAHEVESVVSIYNDTTGYKSWCSYGADVDVDDYSCDDRMTDEAAAELRASRQASAVVDDDDDYEEDDD